MDVFTILIITIGVCCCVSSICDCITEIKKYKQEKKENENDS